MITQTITAVANNLSYLIARVEQGEKVMITQNGKTIAQLISANEQEELMTPDWSAIRAIRESLPVINESVNSLMDQVREARY